MRLVHEAREEDPELSMHQAVRRIGARVGVNADTLRGWCKQADIDAGRRPGTSSGDAQKIKQLANVPLSARPFRAENGLWSSGEAGSLWSREAVS
jgi:transposase-like protein